MISPLDDSLCTNQHAFGRSRNCVVLHAAVTIGLPPPAKVPAGFAPAVPRNPSGSYVLGIPRSRFIMGSKRQSMCATILRSKADVSSSGQLHSLFSPKTREPSVIKTVDGKGYQISMRVESDQACAALPDANGRRHQEIGIVQGDAGSQGAIGVEMAAPQRGAERREIHVCLWECHIHERFRRRGSHACASV